MKKRLLLFVAVVIMAGSALATAPQKDGGAPPDLCPPGTVCSPGGV
jgi:hypothetical protein